MVSSVLQVFLSLLLPAVSGFRSEDGDARLCAFASSLQGAEPALANELRGVVQENGTIRCSRGSRCYGLWEKRADGEMQLLNQGCWTHVGNQQECRSERCVLLVATPSQVWKANYRFCCCAQDLCNANFTEAPPTPDTPALRPMTDGREEGQPGHQLRPEETVLIALVTVAIAAIFIMALFLGYRMMKRKQKHTLCAVDVTEAGNDCAVDLHNLKLQELIGRGRYGAVFRGSLKERCVAVKLFSSANCQNFANERSIYLLLQHHDNVARFLAADERTAADGRPEFLILMEFYPHGCLARYLSVNSVDWLACCRMTHGVTCGLAFLHTELLRGDEHKPAVAHRDLTSRNVLVRADLSCVLADFGLSMRLTGTRPCRPGDDDTMTISEVGTVRYMSPEVLGGALNLRDCEAALKQVDVYALGLLLWESFRRCRDLFPGEVVPEYQLAFQAELGNHPSFEEMQTLVVREKFRPRFPEAWKENSLALRLLKETMEDCWDQDSEARLTAQCAEERLCDLTLMSTHTAVHNYRNLSHGCWPPQGGSASSYIEDLQVGVVKNLQGEARPASIIKTTTSGTDRNAINLERQQAQVQRVAPASLRLTPPRVLPAGQSHLFTTGGAVSNNMPPPPSLHPISESQHTGGAVSSVPACLQLTEEDLEAKKLDPEEVEKNLRENSDENLMEHSQKHFTSEPHSAALLAHQGDLNGAASSTHHLPKQQNLPHRPTSLHLLPKAKDGRMKLGKLKSNERQVQTGVAKLNTVAIIMPAEPHLVTTVADHLNPRSEAPSGKEVHPITVISTGCSAGVPTLVKNEAIGGGRSNPAGPQEEQEEVGVATGGGGDARLNLLNFSPDEHEPLLSREQLPAQSAPPPAPLHLLQGRGSNSNNNNNRVAPGPQGTIAPLMQLSEAPQKKHISDQQPISKSQTTAPRPDQTEDIKSVQDSGSGPSLQNIEEMMVVPQPDERDDLVPDCTGPDSDPITAAETTDLQTPKIATSPTRKLSAPEGLPSDSNGPASQYPAADPGSGTSVPSEPAALEPLTAVLLQTREGLSKARRPKRPCSLDLSSCGSLDDVCLNDSGSLSASGEKIKRRVKTPYTLKKWRPASWVVSTDTAPDSEFKVTTSSSQTNVSCGLLRAGSASCPKINQSKSSIAVFLVEGGATATTTSEPDGMTCF